MTQPAHFLHAHAGEEALKYVEAKALVGGVTTIQGLSASGMPDEGWLIHHVENEKLDNGRKASYQSVLQLTQPADFQAARTEMAAGSAFIYHLAEGTAPSLTAEFDHLAANNCVGPQLVAIHGSALGAPQFQQWSASHGSLVWSPLSNLWLYRATTDVAAARQVGVRLCLGADWGPSGSKHALGELKVADLWNARHLGKLFSDQELCAMVTSNPADAVGLGGHVGRLRAGLRADLLVLANRRPDPYRNLIEATEPQVALVLVAGRPVYGAPALMAQAGARNVQPIGVPGLTQVISLPDPTIPAAHRTWPQIVARLQAIQENPAAAKLAARAPGRESRFQLLLDMPWDPPGFTVEELAAVPTPATIPPLDSLAHDPAFFEALHAAPMLGGLLDGLEDYYAN